MDICLDSSLQRTHSPPSAIYRLQVIDSLQSSFAFRAVRFNTYRLNSGEHIFKSSAKVSATKAKTRTPTWVSNGTLHPQAQLPTRSTSCHPVQRRMKLGHRRHRSDAFASKLRQLLAFSGVNIDEAVHIADAKALNTVLRELLPLGS